MKRFTTYVVSASSPMPIHPNWEHQRKLVEMKLGLGRTHGLAFCTGCLWYIRYPLRESEILNRTAYMHMVCHHFDDLLNGRACIDVDLIDGGEEYLRARLSQVPSP